MNLTSGNSSLLIPSLPSRSKEILNSGGTPGDPFDRPFFFGGGSSHFIYIPHLRSVFWNSIFSYLKETLQVPKRIYHFFEPKEVTSELSSKFSSTIATRTQSFKKQKNFLPADFSNIPIPDHLTHFQLYPLAQTATGQQNLSEALENKDWALFCRLVEGEKFTLQEIMGAIDKRTKTLRGKLIELIDKVSPEKIPTVVRRAFYNLALEQKNWFVVKHFLLGLELSITDLRRLITEAVMCDENLILIELMSYYPNDTFTMLLDEWPNCSPVIISSLEQKLKIFLLNKKLEDELEINTITPDIQLQALLKLAKNSEQKGQWRALILPLIKNLGQCSQEIQDETVLQLLHEINDFYEFYEFIKDYKLLDYFNNSSTNVREKIIRVILAHQKKHMLELTEWLNDESFSEEKREQTLEWKYRFLKTNLNIIRFKLLNLKDTSPEVQSEILLSFFDITGLTNEDGEEYFNASSSVASSYFIKELLQYGNILPDVQDKILLAALNASAWNFLEYTLAGKFRYMSAELRDNLPDSFKNGSVEVQDEILLTALDANQWELIRAACIDGEIGSPSVLEKILKATILPEFIKDSGANYVFEHLIENEKISTKVIDEVLLDLTLQDNGLVNEWGFEKENWRKASLIISYGKKVSFKARVNALVDGLAKDILQNYFWSLDQGLRHLEEDIPGIKDQILFTAVTQGKDTLVETLFNHGIKYTEQTLLRAIYRSMTPKALKTTPRLFMHLVSKCLNEYPKSALSLAALAMSASYALYVNSGE